MRADNTSPSNATANENACRISLRGILLKRKGPANTLAMAEAHNRRKISVELASFSHINPSKILLNQELISLKGVSLEDAVLSVLYDRGIDLNSQTNKRKDKGFAIEWLFSVTLGYEGDHLSLYNDCLSWLAAYYPDCPLVHAVVHYDENEPHMHVIMVPIRGNSLPASNIYSYKGGAKTRNSNLYAAIGKKHGLTLKTTLKGAIKKRAAEVVIEALEKRNTPSFMGNIWPAIKSSIRNSPDGFLDPLGITLAQLVSVESGVISTKGVRHG
jgi:hypothetical protein